MWATFWPFSWSKNFLFRSNEPVVLIWRKSYTFFFNLIHWMWFSPPYTVQCAVWFITKNIVQSSFALGVKRQEKEKNVQNKTMAIIFFNQERFICSNFKRSATIDKKHCFHVQIPTPCSEQRKVCTRHWHTRIPLNANPANQNRCLAGSQCIADLSHFKYNFLAINVF